MRTDLSGMSDDLSKFVETSASLQQAITIAQFDEARPGITLQVRQAHHHLAMVCKEPAFGVVNAVDRKQMGWNHGRDSLQEIRTVPGLGLQSVLSRI